MTLSPEEIEGKEFDVSRRGYDRDEVDDFLVEVAETVRQAGAAGDDAGEAGGEEGADPMRSRLRGGPADTDEFGRLGAEVAAVLRTADEGAARRQAEAEVEARRIREEAEAEAISLRAEAETEATRIRAEAEVEARNARTALAEATEQARVTIAEANEQAEFLARQAEENAEVRRQELLAEAEEQADLAAGLERDVHGRLLAARDDLDRAVTRLEPEPVEEEPVVTEQASALAPDEGDTGPALGLGPPTPPVPPPPGDDLPLAAEGEAPDEPGSDTVADEDLPPVPPPPPPPGPDDLPYAEGDDTERAEGEGPEDGEDGEPVIDLRDGADEEAEDDADEPKDPLAAMVRDAVGKAVQGAMRRQPEGEN